MRERERGEIQAVRERMGRGRGKDEEENKDIARGRRERGRGESRHEIVLDACIRSNLYKDRGTRGIDTDIETERERHVSMHVVHGVHRQNSIREGSSSL